MPEVITLLVAVIVLLLGIPIGNYLAKVTKEELKQGKRWFKVIVILSLAGALISLILRNDALFFTFLFVAIVTSRSLESRRKLKKGKRNRKN